MALITDGTGSGHSARVDFENNLHVQSITVGDNRESTFHGDSYNINTSLVTLTGVVESGVLWFRNDEDRDFLVDAVVVILGPAADSSANDICRVKFYKNSTTGTLFSAKDTAGVINENRNFGSSKTLASTVYKGTNGSTILNGTVIIESLINDGARAYFGIDISLSKGDTLAISYEPPDGNSSMKTMTAIVGHLKDETFVD